MTISGYENDLVISPRTVPPPERPISCYLSPDFWIGARRVREADDVHRTHTRVLEERENLIGSWPFRVLNRTQVIERAGVVPPERVAELNDEALKAIGQLERAVARGRDLTGLPAYHRWLSQGTRPINETITDEEESA